jgi:hypothetical protein
LLDITGCCVKGLIGESKPVSSRDAGHVLDAKHDQAGAAMRNRGRIDHSIDDNADPSTRWA